MVFRRQSGIEVHPQTVQRWIFAASRPDWQAAGHVCSRAVERIVFQFPRSGRAYWMIHGASRAPSPFAAAAASTSAEATVDRSADKPAVPRVSTICKMALRPALGTCPTPCECMGKRNAPLRGADQVPGKTLARGVRDRQRASRQRPEPYPIIHGAIAG